MAEEGGSTGGTDAAGGLERNLRRVLEDFQALSGEVRSAAVLSPEGTLLASIGRDGSGIERDRVSSMLGALAGIAGRAAREKGREHASQVRVKTEKGYVLLTRLEGGATLAATTGSDSRVGLILYDMRNVGREIERVFAEGDQ